MRTGNGEAGRNSPTYLLFALLLLISAVSAVDPGSPPAVLSTANTIYTMTASYTGVANGYNITATNVTLDCGGFSITGSNTSGTYGVYSTQNYTSITNCNIQTFYRGVYLKRSNNSMIQNTIATTSYFDANALGIYLQDSFHNSIINSTGISTIGASADGIGLLTSSYNNIINSSGYAYGYGKGMEIWNSSYNNITGSTGYSNKSSGIWLMINSSYNNIINSIGTTVSGAAAVQIQSYSSQNMFFNDTFSSEYSGSALSLSLGAYSNTLSNCQFTNPAATGGVLYFNDAHNNTIANSTLISYANESPKKIIYLYKGRYNVFINNTLISLSGNDTLITLDVSVGGNTFYWNNFTNTSGYYVNDTNGSNFYNTSISGQAAGNIWFNVINRSVQISGTAASPFTGLYYGSGGSGYPYSTANSQGKLSGTITDYAPLVPAVTSCANLEVAGATYALGLDVSVSGATCFNITAANVTLDCNGFSITGDNSSSTYGVYSTQVNTTVQNCGISEFAYGIYYAAGAQGTIRNNRVSTSADTPAAAISLISNGNGDVVINNTAEAYTGVVGATYAFYSESNNYVHVANNTFTSHYQTAVYLCSGYSNFTNNFVYGIGHTYTYGMSVRCGMYQNNISNNYIQTTGTAAYALYLSYYSSYSNYWNNTIVGGAATALYVSSLGGATIWNNFTGNTITGATAVQVVGSGTRFFNNTITATATGIASTNTVTTDVSIIGNSITAPGMGIALQAGGNDNRFLRYNITNNTIIGGGGSSGAINLYGVNDSRITGNNISGCTVGLATTLFHNSLVEGNTISCPTAGANSGGAIWVNWGTVNNNVFANNTFNHTTNNIAEGVLTTRNASGANKPNLVNNTFINNTWLHTGTAGGILYLRPEAGGNTFYWNNFTNTAGYYVNDTNGSNFYNTTMSGHGEGNIWHNVMNGSVNYTSLGAIASGYGTGWYISNNPAALIPYNFTSSQGKVIGAQDYAPLTYNLFACMVLYNNYDYSMTATGTIIHRSLNPTWLLQILNATTNDISCPLTLNAYVWLGNGTIIANVTSATSPINTTGIPTDMQIYINASAYTLGTGYTWTETRDYFMILDTDTSESDNMVLMAVIGLAVIALLFGYLHVNSKSEIWASLWFFMACMMVMGELMAIQNYATTEGSTAIADVAFALLIGFVWIFIISIWVFLFKLIRDFLEAIKDAYRGKKKEDEQGG